MSTAYATAADLANALPAALLAEVSADGQSAALAAASAKADSYLAARFTLPLTSWGADLTQAVANVAAWTVLSSLGFNPDGKADIAIRQRYEDAIRWFERVADRRANPTVSDSGATANLPQAPRVSTGTARGW